MDNTGWDFDWKTARYEAAEKACAERDARIAELTQQLAEARKDAERWRSHISSGDSHSHTCRKCGHSYTPNDFDTEDCPRCGFDGVDAAIKEQP